MSGAIARIHRRTGITAPRHPRPYTGPIETTAASHSGGPTRSARAARVPRRPRLLALLLSLALLPILAVAPAAGAEGWYGLRTRPCHGVLVRPGSGVCGVGHMGLS